MGIVFVSSGTSLALETLTFYVFSQSTVLAGTSGNTVFGSFLDNSVQLMIAGQIYGTFDTILLNGSDNAVLVTETGRIAGELGTALGLKGARATLENHGEIVVMRDGTTGTVHMDAVRPVITNYGLISNATAQGIAPAVRSLAQADAATVRNFGTLVSNSPDTPTLDLRLGTGVSVVTNGGDILGLGTAVALGVGGGRITNLAGGLLEGGVTGEGGADLVANDGVIRGDVALAGGADRVVNAGTVHGVVTLGADADVYRAVGAARADLVGGEAGNDTIAGGDLAEVLDGGADADLVRGGGGDDTVSGGAGADAVYGEAGDDLVSGDDGEDALFGGAGSDTLFGGLMNDKLFGGDGDDVLSGGGLRDILEGGAGADAFRFVSVTESTTAASDVIRDFQRGLDVIDLEAVNAGELAFMGTGGFATGGAASVRYTISGTTAVLFVDNDGDRVADMRVLVFDTAALEAADLVL